MREKNMEGSRFSKQRVCILVVAAAVAIGSSLSLLAMAPRDAKSGPPAMGSPKKGRLPVVKVRRVRPGRVTQWLIVPGRIECHPNGLETLTARVSGVVAKVYKRNMDAVKKGEPLCEIDQRPYETALAYAQAVLAEKEAELAKAEKGDAARQIAELQLAVKEAETALTQAQRIADHYQKLSKDDLVSLRQAAEAQEAVHLGEAKLAAAKTTLDTYQSVIRPKELTLLRARLAQAKADVQDAQLQLQWCVTIAGRDGELTRFNLHEGMHVDAGVTLGHIVSPGELCAIADVPSERAASIRPGACVRLRPAKADGQETAGVVEAVSSSVEPGAATLPVRVRLIQPPTAAGASALALRPGEFVTAWIAVGQTTESCVLPQSALTQERSQTFVYVVTPKRVAKKVPVALLGRDADGRCAIKGAIKPNAEVIVDGAYNLPDGSRVEVRYE